MKKTVIIDADTGIDDAVAIALAGYLENLDIKLISTICGNLGVTAVTKNTLNLLQAIEKRRIPVAVGSNAPMNRKKDNSIQAHGKRGLGKFEFPPCELKPVKEHAVIKMYNIIKKSKEKIIIIALGPLTNIGKLIKHYPDCLENIEYILVSGGLLEDNKKNPYLGFNVMQDPEAADIVFKSKVKIIVCPSDHGHKAFLTLKEVKKLSQINKTGEMFEFIFRSYKDRHVKVGVATHDPCAVMCVAHPEYFKTKDMYVHIRFLRDKDTGVIDFSTEQTPNVTVATKISVKKFKKEFFECFKNMP